LTDELFDFVALSGDFTHCRLVVIVLIKGFKRIIQQTLDHVGV